jgi:hypothetical protein
MVVVYPSSCARSPVLPTSFRIVQLHLGGMVKLTIKSREVGDTLCMHISDWLLVACYRGLQGWEGFGGMGTISQMLSQGTVEVLQQYVAHIKLQN